MADYSYVFWGERTPILAEKLYQMSENDQHNKDLADSAAQGIIAWMESSADHTFTGGNGNVQTINSFSITKTFDGSRMFKAHFHCPTISGDTDTNARIYVHLELDGTNFAQRQMSIEKNYLRSFADLEGIFTVGAGSHTIKVTGAKYSGGSAATPKLEADALAPMQFWIEDIGSYVSPETP